MSKEVIIGVVVGAIIAGGGLFFTYEGRVSQLEVKVENIPSKQELEDFRKKDLANALDDFPTGSVLGVVQKEVTIPNGWSVCDGTNGTPDLTDKFLMGVSSKREIGVTGGSKNAGTAGSHTHSGSTAAVKGPDHGVHCSGNCAGGRTGNHAHAFTTKVAGNHDHGENRPPYYSTLFICKI